ncbi:MAG TPA: ABC transporter substrate-binding protein [Bacillota bacterium]|nr:ABC transporter substrate-binding protein [Bacillota bacterium]
MFSRSGPAIRVSMTVLLLLLLTLAVGCPRQAAVPPADQPKQGGEVVIAVGASPTSLDPALQNDWNSFRVVNAMFDRLVQKDDKGNLVPSLATRWEVAPDGLTYTLHLRETTFHDGTKFDAHAVKFTFDRHLDPEVGSRYRAWMPEAGLRVEVVDDRTVRFHLQQIQATFLPIALAEWSSLAVSPTAVQTQGAAFAQSPVGTGPFKFKEYVHDSHLLLERNDQYWVGAPYLDTVRIRVIPEASTRVIEMEAGNVDILYDVLPRDAQRLEAAGFNVVRGASNRTEFISFNLSREIMSELALRRAIALAIDREGIIEHHWLGFAVKARAGAAPYSPYYDDTVPVIEYNVTEAKRILDEAGWRVGPDGIRQRDGRPLRLEMLATDRGHWMDMSLVVQDQLRQVGIDTHLVTLEWGTYLTSWVEGKFDLTFHGQGSFSSDTMDVGIGLDPDGYWNVHRLNLVETGPMLAIANQLRAMYDELGVTIDLARRKAIVSEIQKLSQDQQLAAYLWHPDGLFVLSPDLRDYRIVNQVVYLERAWLDR